MRLDENFACHSAGNPESCWSNGALSLYYYKQTSTDYNEVKDLAPDQELLRGKTVINLWTVTMLLEVALFHAIHL